VSAQIAAPRWEVRTADYVSALALRPGGGVAAIGSLSGEARLVDLATGDTIEKLADHAFGVLCAAWSSDGRLLAVGGHDSVVRLYRFDPGDGQLRAVASVAAAGWVARLAWSPVTDLLAVGAGRRLSFVDADGNVRQQCEPVDSTITDVTWAPNGRRVGVAAYGAVSWYDPDLLDSPRPARQHRWKGSLLSLEISPDGRWACVGAQDASIHLWKLWSGDELSMSGYPAKLEHLAFRDDSRWMASACLGELTVWDFSRKGPRGTAPASGEAHGRHIEAMAWRPGGDVLATGGADGRVVLWPSPRKQRERLAPLAVDEHATGVARLAWHGDDLVVGYADGCVSARPIQP
jgi:WD40 repeat protein